MKIILGVILLSVLAMIISNNSLSWSGEVGRPRHQKLEKKMLDGLWVAGGFNYNWKLWAPTYNWFFLWCPLGIFR